MNKKEKTLLEVFWPHKEEIYTELKITKGKQKEMRSILGTDHYDTFRKWAQINNKIGYGFEEIKNYFDSFLFRI